MASFILHRSARRRVSCHAVPLAWLVGKPADSSVSDFLGKRIPRAPSRPSRFARCCRPCPCPRILVTSLAVSWLRPSLNEDPCGLFAAAVLFCWFLPAVVYALSDPLWVRSFVIHHVVLDLYLLCLPGSSITVLFTMSAGIKQVLAVPVCLSRPSRLGFSSCVRSPASMLASASVSLRERRTHTACAM